MWACGQLPTRRDGSTPQEIEEQVRVTLADLDEFDRYDRAYRERLADHPLPPRTTVEVTRFRGTKRIEIDAVATLA